MLALKVHLLTKINISQRPYTQGFAHLGTHNLHTNYNLLFICSILLPSEASEPIGEAKAIIISMTMINYLLITRIYFLLKMDNYQPMCWKNRQLLADETNELKK